MATESPKSNSVWAGHLVMHSFTIPGWSQHEICNVTYGGRRHTNTNFVSLSKLRCSPLGFNSWKIKLHLEFSGFRINATSLNKINSLKLYCKMSYLLLYWDPWISPKCPHHIEWKMTGTNFRFPFHPAECLSWFKTPVCCLLQSYRTLMKQAFSILPASTSG